MGQIRGSSCFQGLMRKQLLATAGFSYWGLQAREAEGDLSFSLGRITSRYFLSFLTLTGFPPLLLPSPALLQMIPSDLRDIFSPVCPALPASTNLLMLQKPHLESIQEAYPLLNLVCSIIKGGTAPFIDNPVLLPESAVH